MIWKHIKGYLIDLDGVVYVDEQPITGSIETLRYLKEKNYPVNFVTNTSNKSIDTLYNKLTDLGLPVERDEILSAAYATALYVKSCGYTRCFGVLDPDVEEDFKDLNFVKTEPDVVIIGDIGRRWNYDLLNDIFNMIMNGADVVAMHKGKFWKTKKGLRMDIGVFVEGLEYATGKKAAIVGKPNASFFEMGLAQLNLQAGEVAMVGDDLESDVGGARQVGLYGILAKTGKFREDHLKQSDVIPDSSISSIKELQKYT